MKLSFPDRACLSDLSDSRLEQTCLGFLLDVLLLLFEHAIVFFFL